MKLSLAILLAIISQLPTMSLAETEWIESEWGKTAFVQMEHTPFPHESRAQGHTYKDKHYPADEHYSDNTVALFIPRSYRAGDTVDLLYYWHGWYNNVRQSFDQYDLKQQVASAGKNVIMVFPEGPKNAPDSSGGRLMEAGEIAALTDEVLAKLHEEGVTKSAELGRVILSGHSGAYKVIGACLEHGGLEDHITEAYLLDASYASHDQYVNWAHRNPEGRLLSIYTKHLREDNEQIMAGLKEKGLEPLIVKEHDHPAETWQQNRLTFLYTTQLDHNQAVQLLEPWLATSGLDPIGASASVATSQPASRPTSQPAE